MPFMMPGARLVVGPHGELEETLGACAPCAALAGAVELKRAALAQRQPAPTMSRSSSFVLGATVAGVGLGLFYLLRRRRRR